MDGRAEGKRSRAKERSQTKNDYFIAKRFVKMPRVLSGHSFIIVYRFH